MKNYINLTKSTHSILLKPLLCSKLMITFVLLSSLMQAQIEETATFSARETMQEETTSLPIKSHSGTDRATDSYSSATYTSGEIDTDRGFTSASGSSDCPGTLVVTIPEDAIIISVDVSYSMTARFFGTKSQQRSQLRCVSPGGTAESQIFEGTGNGGGTQNYSRSGLTIANGVSGGGDIVFELHAGRTWGWAGCNTLFNKVDHNSWTVTVHYQSPSYPDFTANPLTVTPGQAVTFTDMSTGNIQSWEWEFGNGAIPQTATHAGPHQVIYSSVGYKTVSLTINGNSTETKNDYILVAEPDNWLHWDDGTNARTAGLTAAGIFQTAARFEPADISLYNAYQITMLKVYVGGMPNSATIKIWQGTDAQNLTEYVSQGFSPQANSWNTIQLNTPYIIDINRELWFGVEWNDPGNLVRPIGLDDNTDEDGKGNLLRLNINDPDGWQTITTYNIEGDNNLQAFLVPTQISWTGSVSTDWNNPGNWSNFSVPQPGSDILIPQTANHPVINNEVTVNNITVQAGAALNIGPQGSLTVEDNLTNHAGVSGITVQSNAGGTGSLLYTNGPIPASFQRYIKGEAEAWHLLSSPVDAQEISGEFTPAGTYGDGTGYDFFTWYEPDTSWVYLLNTDFPPTWSQTQAGNDFVPGKGYLVAYQQENPIKTFTGNLTQGSVSIPLTQTDGKGDQSGINLVGNPYPSSIDWKSASGWNRSILEAEGGGYNIWIWNDTAYNYGVYNSASVSDQGTLGVTRYIPPTQGFFVKAAQSGNLSMTNEVRTHFGSDHWLKSDSKEKMFLISLNSKDDLGHDQVVIEFGQQENAAGIPKKFSLYSWAPSLYIPRKGIPCSMIMLHEDTAAPVLPLVVKAGRTGTYQITVYADAVNTPMLKLIDQNTGISQDMLKQPVYHFNTLEQEEHRFVLQFQPGVFPDPFNELPVEAYASNQTLYLDLRLVKTDCKVQIFDIMGRQIRMMEKAGGAKYMVPLSDARGVYIIRITSGNSQLRRKIIF